MHQIYRKSANDPKPRTHIPKIKKFQVFKNTTIYQPTKHHIKTIHHHPSTRKPYTNTNPNHKIQNSKKRTYNAMLVNRLKRRRRLTSLSTESVGWWRPWRRGYTLPKAFARLSPSLLTVLPGRSCSGGCTLTD